ncbi:MAG: BolA/IbaG family iron-sulfur metabolism protein [gamma proteobacterium symbiont of Bathyaustriella thionipta]|nr:BolA/IbaG family iron-sulfur metabolism protein [gamma proteobacterium symbiont of Bathyaustriella thionipta]MCU7949530.1 BolA/IbaG family iron-sulfur metabolism protein [gamma proteobacterium symbiont of Bathyaustriella thionipta]MCU7954254.1 BolA/IbaG family iron-sulfur metabolism protein [gamma proteobacterium symbiont of Bathyaustriella thionipta]MCU7956130.1 BolA/IbaG family iron-sulfur metabolism protein [gamma proteobacterium symbiont of Bathyaustriella thionipta]MCU7968731.1 BolA/Iba
MSLQAVIEKKLNETFSPSYLVVENESHMHNVPAGSEMHFKVLIVSDSFEGQMLIKRHRAVNKALEEELAGPIHALSMHTFTQDEWAKRNGQVQDSPPCQGGGK